MPDDKPTLAKLAERIEWVQKTFWRVAIAYAAIFTGLVTWYLPKELGELRQTSKADMSEQLGPINERLAALTTSIEFLTPGAAQRLPRILKENLRNDSGRKLGLLTIAALAGKAKETQLRIDPDDLVPTADGVQLIRKQDPIASPAADVALQTLITYRSYLNGFYVPAINNAVPLPANANATDAYFHIIASGKPISFQMSGPDLPIDKGARAERLDSPVKTSVAPKYYIVNAGGSALVLDQYFLKNVVVRDAIVSYHGGPVRLESVFFVDCTFDITNAPNGQDFQAALINRLGVTFQK